MRQRSADASSVADVDDPRSSQPKHQDFAPLRGLRVVELGDGIAAAFCGRILSWLGAAVVRVETRGDDLSARWSVDGDGFGRAAYDYCHASKDIIRDASAAEVLPDLLAAADVLVSDWTAAALESAGLDPADLGDRHPALVFVSVTGYGLRGPHAEWPSSELTTYHSGGEGYLLPGNPVFSMFPDRPPVRGGRFLADYDAGLAAAVGGLAALVARCSGGVGDLVEVSAQEVQLGLNRTTLSRCFYEQRDVDRGDRGYDYGGILEAADGWVTLRPTEDRQYRRFLRFIGRPDLAEDPRYATRAARDRNGEALTAELLGWSRPRPREEIRAALLAAECPGGPFLEMAEVLADPVLQERELFTEQAGGLAPGRLFRLQRSDPAGVPTLPGRVGSQQPGSRGRGRGPLAGIRVLDMSWVAAGPYATELLALMGADVIKVESRDRPDLFRRLVQERSDDLDTSIRFLDLNQRKRSICLDLKSEGGREVLLRLAGVSDIVVDNFRPGVRDRLGIGDVDLRAQNPAVVTACLSGFGSTGAMRSRPGYASVFNAESGIGAMTGYPDGPPTEIRDSNDLRAGMATCAAALAALLERLRHGNAASVELAAREVLVAMQGDALLEASRGAAPTRSGNALGRLIPYGCFRGADGLWVAVSVRDTAEWQNLVEVVADPGLADPALKDPLARWESRDLVERLLCDWIVAKPADVGARLLCEAGVPAAVSAPASLLRADEHLAARNFFATVSHSKLGDVTVIGPPIRFWRAGPPPRSLPSPLLGEHTRQILEADLGASTGEVAALLESGAAT